jgi:hypothetical protein
MPNAHSAGDLRLFRVHCPALAGNPGKARLQSGNVLSFLRFVAPAGRAACPNVILEFPKCQSARTPGSSYPLLSHNRKKFRAAISPLMRSVNLRRLLHRAPGNLYQTLAFLRSVNVMDVR